MFLASVYLKVNYQREYILDKFGLNAGLMLIHYSNASFKTPNLGINTLALNVGVNYNLDEQETAPEKNIDTLKVNSPITYNAIFRTGFNESLINGSGRHPFYTISFSAAKKLNYKSTISAGTDVFLATFTATSCLLSLLIFGTPVKLTKLIFLFTPLKDVPLTENCIFFSSLFP